LKRIKLKLNEVSFERRVGAEKYYVLDTDLTALNILKIKEQQPILILYNFHRKMFAEF